MAIASYNDLVAAIPKWAERADITTDQIKEFIALTESDASQLLRVPAMESAIQLPVVDGRVTIPFDYLELRRLTWEGDVDEVLDYLPWDQFVTVNRGHPGTQPLYFSRQGPIWFISGEPGDNDTVLCHYYNFIPALSDTNENNWLLLMSPQAYLYGSLKYLYEFLMDTDRSIYWENKFKLELSKLQSIADTSEYRGTTLVVRSI